MLIVICCVYTGPTDEMRKLPLLTAESGVCGYTCYFYELSHVAAVKCSCSAICPRFICEPLFDRPAGDVNDGGRGSVNNDYAESQERDYDDDDYNVTERNGADLDSVMARSPAVGRGRIKKRETASSFPSTLSPTGTSLISAAGEKATKVRRSADQRATEDTSVNQPVINSGLRTASPVEESSPRERRLVRSDAEETTEEIQRSAEQVPSTSRETSADWLHGSGEYPVWQSTDEPPIHADIEEATGVPHEPPHASQRRNRGREGASDKPLYRARRVSGEETTGNNSSAKDIILQEPDLSEWLFLGLVESVTRCPCNCIKSDRQVVCDCISSNNTDGCDLRRWRCWPKTNLQGTLFMLTPKTTNSRREYGLTMVTTQVTHRGKGKGMNTCYSAAYTSQTRDQQRFTISEVAADWHEPVVLQRIMWPSIAHINGQLDPRCS